MRKTEVSSAWLTFSSALYFFPKKKIQRESERETGDNWSARSGNVVDVTANFANIPPAHYLERCSELL